LIQFVGDRKGHDRRYAIDTQKMEDDLGWEPEEDLETGLRKTALWYLENEAWVKAIVEEKDYQLWLEINYAQRGGTA
jgi:dTDP-glucose 4,6-dehydratase